AAAKSTTSSLGHSPVFQGTRRFSQTAAGRIPRFNRRMPWAPLRWNGAVSCVLLVSGLLGRGPVCRAASRPRIRLDIAGRVPLANKGGVLALAPDQSRLYVAEYNHDRVAVIDTRAKALLREVLVSHSPIALAVSPDGQRVYVGQWAGQREGQLSVIDARSGIARELHVGGPVAGLALSADGRIVYLAM